MSEHQPLPAEQQLPIKKYLDSSRALIATLKGFEFRRLFEGLILFFSMITAYFYVEITHQHPETFEKLINIKLNQSKTVPKLFFFLSLYLIFWNLLAHFLKNRAMTPPKKVNEYDEMVQEQPEVLPTLPLLPHGEKYLHQIIRDSLNTAVYNYLFLVSLLSYAYFNQLKKPNMPPLVSIERINYLFIWFLTGSLFKFFGNIAFKVTKIKEFRILGVTIKTIVALLAIGLAHGLNSFIFI